MLTPEQRAYMAGILDGEGYLFAQESNGNLGVRVAMIDREVPDWCEQHFGGRVLQSGVTSAGNPVWRWEVSSRAAARTVLEAVEPYVVLKRGQVRAMLDLISHLDSAPRWETETKHENEPERARRRSIRAEWSRRASHLRVVVRESRSMGVKG